MLLAAWQPSWQHGNADQMLQAIRELLRDLQLPELEPLDPSALRGDSARGERRGGAHNAAMLLCVKAGASLGIGENLAYLAEHLDLIPGTALETLGRGWASAARAAPEPDKTPGAEKRLLLVTPDELNESQELVLRLAMSRPLTIATGPPGTGKTQLVVNVVATAVCAKQSVLVASTNNRAVDEVSKRCTKHAPGLLIRTGNKEEREKERAFHRSLLAGTAPQRDSVPTTAGELSNERRRISAWRKDLAAQVDREARLREALEARTAAGESLALPIELLALAWQNGTGDLAQWANRARGASDITLFAGRRRRRIVERYARAVQERGGDPEPLRRRLAGDANALDALVSFVDAECVLRDNLKAADAPSDDDLHQRGHELTARSLELSRKLVQSLVAGRVASAHPQIEARATALATGKEPQRTQRELMEDLPGWAITTHSILQLRREPQMFDLVVIDEASQCSIPAVLPLLFRAKRALIIGDTKQHSSVTSLPFRSITSTWPASAPDSAPHGSRRGSSATSPTRRITPVPTSQVVRCSWTSTTAAIQASSGWSTITVTTGVSKFSPTCEHSAASLRPRPPSDGCSPGRTSTEGRDPATTAAHGSTRPRSTVSATWSDACWQSYLQIRRSAWSRRFVPRKSVWRKRSRQNAAVTRAESVYRSGRCTSSRAVHATR
jgi:hypothetical protein